MEDKLYWTKDPITNIYQVNPIKSVDIPKSNGETRPLGILEWTEKVKYIKIKLVDNMISATHK